MVLVGHCTGDPVVASPYMYLSGKIISLDCQGGGLNSRLIADLDQFQRFTFYIKVLISEIVRDLYPGFDDHAGIPVDEKHL